MTQPGEAAPGSDVQQVEQSRFRAFVQDHKVGLGLTGVGVVLVGMGAAGVAALNSESDSNQTSASENRNSDAHACDELRFEDTAANPTRFSTTAFLPLNNVNSGKALTAYKTVIFGEQGPLGGKADKGSLAAFSAVITERATGSETIDPNYNYTEHFNEIFNTFNATAGSLEAAIQQCEDGYGAMTELASYKAVWANQGEELTAFIPVRDAQNRITGFTVEYKLAPSALGGVVIESNDTAKQYPGGVPSTLISNEGVFYVKGFVKQPEAGNNNENGQPTPTPEQAQGGSAQSGNRTGNANQGEGQSAGGGSANGSTGNKSKGQGEGQGTGGESGTCGGCGQGTGGGSGGGNGGGGTGGGCSSCGGGNGGGGSTPKPTTPPPTTPKPTPTPTKTPEQPKGTPTSTVTPPGGYN